MTEPLITKYRPTSFSQVVGNEAVVRSLSAAVAKGNKTFLFTGPSGLGKTSLARIVATQVGATVVDICAAVESGVDNTRNIVEFSQFRPLDGKSVMYIIDECHNLSKKGWEPLLKITEEPPAHLYFGLCTTEPGAVPETIKTRCHPVTLKPLKPNELSDLLEAVASLEEWIVEDSVFSAILGASQGSPRRALTILQAGHAAKTREELASIIIEVEREDAPALEICKLLMQGAQSWERIRDLLGKVDKDTEIIAPCLRYITNEMVKGSEDKAILAYNLLLGLATFKVGYDQKAQFAGAVCSVLWSNNGTQIRS